MTPTFSPLRTPSSPNPLPRLTAPWIPNNSRKPWIPMTRTLPQKLTPTPNLRKDQPQIRPRTKVALAKALTDSSSDLQNNKNSRKNKILRQSPLPRRRSTTSLWPMTKNSRTRFPRNPLSQLVYCRHSRPETLHSTRMGY